MMIESCALDQSGLGPQVKDVWGRISLVSFHETRNICKVCVLNVLPFHSMLTDGDFVNDV